MDIPFISPKKQIDLELFTIYDTKTQSYGDPTAAHTHHDLIRDVVNMMRDPKQQHNKLLLNAEDFRLFRVGTWDKKSGTLTTMQPEHIVNFNDLRALAQPEIPGPGIVPT